MIGFYVGGYFTFLTVVIAYIIIPIIDGMVPASTENLQLDIAQKKMKNFYFDLLLLVNLPLVWIVLWLFLSTMMQGGLASYEIVGLVFTTAIVLTTSGINVAHELGHKPQWYYQRVAHLLLLPSMYMHFFIEHNRGHHLYVSTEKDPASAKRGEMFYAFWVRSVVGQWIGAWKLEKKRLKKIWVIQNQMIHFTLIQLLFVGFIYMTFGMYVRKKLANGRYEKVTAQHSWNSNHELGRIMLYELTRHSDHHYKSAKKYQVLDHHDDSPQLPYGMLMSLIPPLWFAIMDERIPT